MANSFMMLKDLKLADKLSPVFTEILKERINQNKKWGEQNHPMLADFEINWFPTYSCLETTLINCRIRLEENKSWFDILLEEFLEAFLEVDIEKQQEKMIQVAAVSVAMIEYLDKKITEEL
jgi:hypothetical protein